MTQDFIHIFFWWAFLFTLGILSFPLSHLLFKRFSDLGWGLSKTVGILVVSYAAFLFSIAKVLPLTRTLLIVYVVIFGALNLFIFIRERSEILTSLRKNWRSVCMSEILFAMGILFWSYVRAHQPDINGLEKFMDYGFIQTLLRAEYLPPKDMWASGLSINYYWYGHYVAAFITKIVNIPASIAYNLMLATILGLALSSAFSIAGTLIKTHYKKVSIRVVLVGALLSTLLLSFGGNFHTPFYVISKSLSEGALNIQEGAKTYWYPDATRFIGYNPDTNDKTIHEFPLYSYVVADLHGHLLNLPFVLLFIATLFSKILDGLLQKTSSRQSPVANELFNSKISKLIGNWKLEIGNYIPLGFLLGIMFMTSTWDFGNYSILTGVTFGYLALQHKKISLDMLFDSIFPTLKVFGLGILFALPFILNFESIAEGADLVNARTPIWQLLILWGFPFVLSAVFLLVSPITRFFKFTKSDLFALALLTTSIILIILPEIVYVKDIYIASHHRANTMFKLTYQAFVMSYLASGFIIVRLMIAIKNQLIKLLVFLAVTFTLTGLFIYPYFAITSYYGNIFIEEEVDGTPRYKGLNGETWLLKSHPEEYAVIEWLRENVDGQPTILEAQGDSYTEYNVISSYTGLPTVNGWYVHEWLWRGSSEFPQLRANDVQELYLSNDLSYTKQLTDKYAIQYVIVGNFEREKYPTLNEEKWNQLGEKVFTSGSTSVYKIQ